MIVCSRFPVHPRTAAHATHATPPPLPLSQPSPYPSPSYPHCYQPARTAATTNRSSDFHRLPPPPRLHASRPVPQTFIDSACLRAAGGKAVAESSFFVYVYLFTLMLLLYAVVESRDVTRLTFFSRLFVCFGNVCANTPSAFGLGMAREGMAYCGKMNIYANCGYYSSLALLSCAFSSRAVSPCAFVCFFGCACVLRTCACLFKTRFGTCVAAGISGTRFLREIEVRKRPRA